MQNGRYTVTRNNQRRYRRAGQRVESHRRGRPAETRSREVLLGRATSYEIKMKVVTIANLCVCVFCHHFLQGILFYCDTI